MFSPILWNRYVYKSVVSRNIAIHLSAKKKKKAQFDIVALYYYKKVIFTPSGWKVHLESKREFLSQFLFRCVPVNVGMHISANVVLQPWVQKLQNLMFQVHKVEKFSMLPSFVCKKKKKKSYLNITL